MPELPDVECFKNYFQQTALNQKIVEIEAESKELIKKCKFENFKKKLLGKKFKRVWRKGKFMIVEIANTEEKLVFHFGMTGDLNYVQQGVPLVGEDRFARIIFKFDSGWELRWINIRKFGKVWSVKDPREIRLIREMGPDPLELSKSEFLKLLEKNKQRNLKAFLLDQRAIAGIGNVYSDEILFLARISPRRKIASLTLKEREKLADATQKILRTALKLNLPRGEPPKSWILANRKPGTPCPKNPQHSLKREIIAGRAALWCSKCQK